MPVSYSNVDDYTKPLGRWINHMKHFWYCPGERNRNAKLTEAQAKAIRQEFASGLRGLARAKEYGISPVNYNRIGRGVAWKHIALTER